LYYDEPCFARDSLAVLPSGDAVPMGSLRSGDIVKDGPDSTTRVVVNQHRGVHLTSRMLKIDHTNGSLTLTPDHVLYLDGAFAPARDAKRGSTLIGDLTVTAVTATAAEVANPLTASGKILTQGGALATAYPEWIAAYMLSSYVPLPFSVCNGITYVFPETTQAFYDDLLESLFQATAPSLVKLKGVVPSPLVPIVFIVFDLALACGFIAYSLASLKGMLLGVAAGGVLVARKARKEHMA
jgi:hypothetical protein